MGIPATNKSVEFEVLDFVRLEDGNVAEHWGLTDAMSLMQHSEPKDSPIALGGLSLGPLIDHTRHVVSAQARAEVREGLRPGRVAWTNGGQGGERQVSVRQLDSLDPDSEASGPSHTEALEPLALICQQQRQLEGIDQLDTRSSVAAA
jgi:SnoaL-like polyketide cyclase